MRRSLLSKFFLAAGTVLLAGCVATKNVAQEPPPLWASYETLSEVFPPQDYLAQIGFSDTAERAQVQADAALSSYISHTVLVQTAVTESMRSDGANTEAEKSLVRNVDSTSRAAFVALRHTDAYFDTARRQYAVCAYINRHEAWERLKPKLQTASRTFTTAYQESQREKERFQKILLLHGAQHHADDFYQTYALATEILPAKAADFASVDAVIQKAFAESTRLKTETGIALNVAGDDTGRVRTKLAEIFSAQGFSVGSAGEAYTAHTAVHLGTMEQAGVFVAYPQISVTVAKTNGTTVASWARQLEKVSSYTKAAAERMALHAVEQALENSFVTDCLQR